MKNNVFADFLKEKFSGEQFKIHYPPQKTNVPEIKNNILEDYSCN